MTYKKHLTLLATVAIAISFSSKAKAEEPNIVENVYFEATSFGPSDSGMNSVNLGYRPLADKGLMKNSRFEQQMSYNSDSEKMKFMSNVVYEFYSESQVKPYIGVGAGVMSFGNKNNFDDNQDSSEEEIVPAYQVMSGVSYEPNFIPSVKLELGYGYSAAIGDPAYNNATDDDYQKNDHSVAAALKFKF